MNLSPATARPFMGHDQTTFQGFSRPLIEDMMSQASVVRKKASPAGMGEVNVDVGRYFAHAYALGLARGAR